MIRTAATLTALGFALACQTPREAAPVAATQQSVEAAPAPKTKGARYTIKDNGKRCFAAPCDSWTATNVDTGETIDVAGIDLGPLGLNEDMQRLMHAEIAAGRQAVRAEIVPSGTGRGAKVPQLRAVKEDK